MPSSEICENIIRTGFLMFIVLMPSDIQIAAVNSGALVGP
jgi:hypothetical protein